MLDSSEHHLNYFFRKWHHSESNWFMCSIRILHTRYEKYNFSTPPKGGMTFPTFCPTFWTLHSKNYYVLIFTIFISPLPGLLHTAWEPPKDGGNWNQLWNTSFHTSLNSSFLVQVRRILPSLNSLRKKHGSKMENSWQETKPWLQTHKP